MLALVLGYTATGSQAPVSVLYAGRSASEAAAIADAPPAGILRTEVLKNPVTHHRRHFPGNVLPPEILAEAQLGLAPDHLPANTPEESPAKDSKPKK